MSNLPIPAILAVDPGKTSAAFAFLAYDGTVLHKGMFETPISELEQPHLGRQAFAFAKEVRSLLTDSRYTVTKLVIERYQQRKGGSVKGNTGAAIEFVNVIIGVCLVLGIMSKPYVEMHPVMPVTWKNWLSQLVYGTILKSKGGMESAAQAFGFHVTKEQKRVPIRDHEFDAIGQGLWYLCSKKPRDQWQAVFDTTKTSLQAIWDAGITVNRPKIVAKVHAAPTPKSDAKPRARRARK